MDIVHWNQAPTQVNAGLPMSRRGAAGLDPAERTLAVQEARANAGFVGALGQGMTS